MKRPTTPPLIGKGTLALCALGLGLMLGSCRASQGPQYNLPDQYSADQIPRVIAVAQEDLSEDDDPGLAFARLDLAYRTSGAKDEALQSLQRARADAFEAYLERMVVEEVPPGYYQRLLDADLTRNQAVRARIARARALLDRGERIKAYRAIKTMDGLYPYHAERQASGRLLYDAGMSLARDKGRYGLFFRFRRLAPEVLEYMTTTYYSGEWSDERSETPRWKSTIDPDLNPTECGAVAYEELSQLYAESGDYALAIQRLEDLILYYGDSPRVRACRARIPTLRLEAVSQADHDRYPIELALGELNAWLSDYQGQEPELEVEVQRQRLHAIQQLADHDLIVAEFYWTVDNLVGAQDHAERALELAQDGGSPEQVEQVEAFLAKLRQAGASANVSEEARP